MAGHSKLFAPPKDLRDQLDRKLLDHGFGCYDHVTSWLNGQLLDRGLDLTISRSSLARYGAKLAAKNRHLLHQISPPSGV